MKVHWVGLHALSTTPPPCSVYVTQTDDMLSAASFTGSFPVKCARAVYCQHARKHAPVACPRVNVSLTANVLPTRSVSPPRGLSGSNGTRHPPLPNALFSQTELLCARGHANRSSVADEENLKIYFFFNFKWYLLIKPRVMAADICFVV